VFKAITINKVTCTYNLLYVKLVKQKVIGCVLEHCFVLSLSVSFTRIN